MSAPKQYNNLKTTTTSKFSKNLLTTEAESKFELIDASEHSELIGKLSDQVGNFSRELNNNSISPGSTVEGSGLFGGLRMDPKGKSPNESSKQSTTTSSLAIEKNGDAKVSVQEEEPVLQIPSYSSIFTPSLYSKSASPSQQQQHSYRQLPLKSDQSGYRDQDENQVSANCRFSGRKLASSKCNDNKSKHESFEAEDDLDEEEIDEKMPFNNKKYRSSGKRVSPGGSQRCRSPNTGKQPIFAFNNHSRCESDHQPNPHTKISIHDGRLPTLGVCNQNGPYSQQNESYSNRKIYLPEQPLCYRCDCNDCHRKLKSTSGILDGGSNPTPESYSKSHSRTKSIHLVLKSIILVLLTLLLLMLFVGIILASHYLPQVFDRVLNASRSFNVTIAG